MQEVVTADFKNSNRIERIRIVSELFRLLFWFALAVFGIIATILFVALIANLVRI